MEEKRESSPRSQAEMEREKSFEGQVTWATTILPSVQQGWGTAKVYRRETARREGYKQEVHLEHHPANPISGHSSS